MSALNKQVGGRHYKDFEIQPVEYIHKNGIGYMAGNVIKYVSRYKFKNGKEDLEKAIHHLEMLIEQDYPDSIAKDAVLYAQKNGVTVKGEPSANWTPAPEDCTSTQEDDRKDIRVEVYSDREGEWNLLYSAYSDKEAQDALKKCIENHGSARCRIRRY